MLLIRRFCFNVTTFQAWFIWKCGRIRLAFVWCNSSRSVMAASLRDRISWGLCPPKSTLVMILPCPVVIWVHDFCFNSKPNLGKLDSLCSLGLEKLWIKVTWFHMGPYLVDFPVGGGFLFWKYFFEKTHLPYTFLSKIKSSRWNNILLSLQLDYSKSVCDLIGIRPYFI